MSVIVSPTYRPTTNGFYAKNTVPTIELEATENVSIDLRFWPFPDRNNADWGDADIVFQGSYAPDFNGEIHLDFNDLYGTFVNTKMAGNANPVINQDDSIGVFHLSISGSESGHIQVNPTLTWFVCNAELKASLPFLEWSAVHFLTNQPIEKRTNYEAPEWITYLDTDGDWNLVARFYPKEGGMVDALPQTDTAIGCYSVDVSYARLIPMVARMPHQLKGYYDIILMDGNLEEICRQRFIYNERTGREHYYLFTNALGGIDTLICDGENVLQPEVTHNIGRFGRLYKAIDDTDDRRQWQQNTGQMPCDCRNWLFEMLSSKQGIMRYDAQLKEYQSIVLTGSNMEMSDWGRLGSAEFTYILAEVAKAIDEDERPVAAFRQSVADEAEELEDISTKRTLMFVATGSGYETDEIEIPAPKLYVEFEQPGDAERNETIYYSIDGKLAGDFTPGTDPSPVVITMKEGQTIQFTSQDLSVELLELSYYPNIV